MSENKNSNSDLSLRSNNISLSELKQLHEMPNAKPVCLVDSAGTIIYCNKIFTSLFDIIEGEDFSKIESEPSLPSLFNNFSGSQFANFHFDFHFFSAVSSEQSAFIIDIEKVVIKDSYLFLLVFTSTRETSAIEERINNLHNALEYGDVAVIITDDKGIINYSSQSFEKIFDTNIELLFNHHVSTVVNKYLDEKEISLLNFAIKNKREWIKLISDVNQDGSAWYKEIKLNPVRRNDTEKVNFILTANDITNYILKNRISQQTEERQKSVINNISDLLLIVRKEKDKIVFENANDNFHNELGIVKERVKEKNLIEFLPLELYDELKKAIVKFSKENEHRAQFNYSDKKKGREYMCKLTCTEDPFEKMLLFILSMSDITEQLMHEEKLKEAYQKETQLNKLKTAFLANMSHEIRTPLNAIVGYSDLLEDEVLETGNESLGEIIDYLKDGVKRLLDLVENIVEVSILESGELNLDLITIGVNSFIENILPDYLRKQEPADIIVKTDLDPRNPMMKADESKLKKICDMLVDNAIKYNVRKGLVILRTRAFDDTVSIEIEDTGIGIDDQKVDQLLQPFSQQEEEGYRRNYEGAGLGLTIAYRLTQVLGGSLDIRSKADKGTIVTLSFKRVL